MFHDEALLVMAVMDAILNNRETIILTNDETMLEL